MFPNSYAHVSGTAACLRFLGCGQEGRYPVALNSDFAAPSRTTQFDNKYISHVPLMILPWPRDCPLMIL